ncbi:hypothetical protein Vafri_2374 [Volvox africanus]|nr:hypothetical protein Vafri_2374 [Volvox africanus]
MVTPTSVTLTMGTVLVILAFSTAFQSVLGQYYRGFGENICPDIASDYMYRFRVAVTPRSNLACGIIGSSSALGCFNVSRSTRGFASPRFSAPSIPGLSEKQPVLNVDTSTDKVYFIHPVDGRIYCYDITRGTNATAAVWVSSFVCSDPTDPRNQHRQSFTANGTQLLARCNNSVVLLGEQGELRKTFSGKSIQDYVAASDLAAPISVFGNFTRMTTWITNSSGAFLEVWYLDSSSKNPQRPAATLRLPAGVNITGVNTDSPWWTIVADRTNPVVHVLNSLTGIYQSRFDLKPEVDPNNTMRITLLPTPVIANRVMYGVVHGVLPSPVLWSPDKHFWWLFAANYTDPKAPRLLWLSQQIATRGPISPQVPWVTAAAVFVSDYQQNVTRSFDRTTGQSFFNVPANPYFSGIMAYSLSKGTYKMSLPWASPDGYFLIFQADDWFYEQMPPDERVEQSRGSMQTVRGFPYSPSPPPTD